MNRKFLLCYFETTRQCNLTCAYCMTRSDSISKEKQLDTEEAKHLVLDEIKKICPTGLVAFSGGEFLLRKDALELLRYNSQLGLYSFINTNGQCLTNDLLKEIKHATNNKITFAFSLDSLDEGVQGQTRKNKPSEILNLVEMCDREQVGYFFLVTITKRNLSTLAETVTFLKARKIPMIRSPFVPRGAGQAMQELVFDRKDMQETIYPILRDNYLSYISYIPFFASPEFMAKTWHQLDIPIPSFGCQASRGFIGISPEGNVAPCVHLLDTTLDCGNVRQSRLSELLETNPILSGLKDRSQIKGKCGRCRYQYTCGGCRALAYYATGDYLTEDPTCFFEPRDKQTISEYEGIQNQNVARFLKFVIQHKPWNEILCPASFWSKVKALLWTLTHAGPRPEPPQGRGGKSAQSPKHPAEIVP